ncbi:RsiV family protein [Kaistella anthropi]|nr:RsiV family protein [Kaistella anthropi]
MDDFITIQYTASGYTGGAHGYYNEIYKVFDLKTNKTLQLSDILKVQDAEIWSRILMDHFLKNDLEKGQAAALLVKEIPLNNNFYFDKEYLYFLYNQYEIAAYAAGSVLIKIPLSEIKPFLNDEFKTRLKL